MVVTVTSEVVVDVTVNVEVAVGVVVVVTVTVWVFAGAVQAVSSSMPTNIKNDIAFFIPCATSLALKISV